MAPTRKKRMGGDLKTRESHSKILSKSAKLPVEIIPQKKDVDRKHPFSRRKLGRNGGKRQRGNPEPCPSESWTGGTIAVGPKKTPWGPVGGWSKIVKKEKRRSKLQTTTDD